MGPWLFARPGDARNASVRYAGDVHQRVLHIYHCQPRSFIATRVGKYKVWHKGAKDHKLPANFIHDTEKDPFETRAASVTAGLKKYLLSRANSAFDSAMTSVQKDQKAEIAKPTVETAICCNRNFYDCHCPFPEGGIDLLASSPPVRVTPREPPPPTSDERCDAPARTDPPLSTEPLAPDAGSWWERLWATT